MANGEWEGSEWRVEVYYSLLATHYPLLATGGAVFASRHQQLEVGTSRRRTLHRQKHPPRMIPAEP
jgi:hypothetical protein